MNQKNFYGRDFELGQIAQILKSGENVFVEGLRRMGKTMIVQELLRAGNISDKGDTYYFYVDVGSCTSNMHFFEKLSEAIDKAHGPFAEWLDKAGKKLDSIDEISFMKIAIKLRTEPQAAEELIDTLDQVSNQMGCRIVIILDEYPLMLWKSRNGNAIDIIARIKEIADHRPNIRFVFTGSTGLQYSKRALAKVGNTTDLKRNSQTIIVKGFNSDELGIGFSEIRAIQADSRDLYTKAFPDIHRVIARECDNVPKWIEVVWQNIGNFDIVYDEEGVLNILQKMLDAGGDLFSLDQYQDRLEGYESEFGPNPLKEEILLELSQYPDGASKEDIRAAIKTLPDYDEKLYRRAIEELCDDHYIIQSEGRLSFPMNLLRRYWEAKR